MNRVRMSVLALASVAALGAAACGGGGSGQNVALGVNVAGNKMTPDKLSARQDDMVTLKVTADKAETIHLHGYDYKFEMKPGETQTKTFKADKTGSFEVEIEDTSTHLGELDVQPR
jgi:ABC-type glycerol-3-phosphate transport system substrate-binding protein